MTPAEFIANEVPNFQPGQIIVVSGADLATIYDLLFDARDALRGMSRLCLDPIDTRDTISYPSDTAPRAFKFEYLAIANQGTNVVLVGNQFDPSNFYENPHPVDILVDVVRDLMNWNNVEFIPPRSTSLFYPATRELFQFISKIYYYDTTAGTVTFLKNQISERP